VQGSAMQNYALQYDAGAGMRADGDPIVGTQAARAITPNRCIMPRPRATRALDAEQTVNRARADENDVVAQYNLGKFYYDHRRIRAESAGNKDEAVKWLRRAADQGHAQAQYHLGRCYDCGFGVGIDKMRAFMWHLAAGLQGDAHAQYQLGSSYYSGHGIERDRTKAVWWYTAAAEQKLANAEFALGQCFFVGQGVAENKEKAAEWCQRAAAHGHAIAKNYIKRHKVAAPPGRGE